MRFSIEHHDTGISIRIDDVMGPEQTVLERIRRCKQTAWAPLPEEIPPC